MPPRLQTLHAYPGKQGVNIDLTKYTQIQAAIQSVLTSRGEVRFKDLSQAVEEILEPGFGGSISWYVTSLVCRARPKGLTQK